MEPQPNPPPGWYPDPAGGPHHRYWDGMQWKPASPSTPSRRRMVVIATLAAVLIAAVVLVDSALGPSLGDVTDEADKLTFPPGLTLVDEYSVGNQLCFDSCVELGRVYTSPSPAEVTLKIVVSALKKAGYRCVPTSRCANFERGFASLWQRGTDSLTTSIEVGPVPGDEAFNWLSDIPFDPAWRSYVVVSVSQVDLSTG